MVRVQKEPYLAVVSQEALRRLVSSALVSTRTAPALKLRTYSTTWRLVASTPWTI
jgi:hypothetical protein